MNQTIKLDGLWTAELGASELEAGGEGPTEPRRQDAPAREQRSRRVNAPRFVGLLAVLCLLATLIWFHVRIRAVESARSSAEQAVADSAAMGTARASPPLEEPVRPAPPPADVPVLTPITGAPEIRVAAKPIRPERVSPRPERAPARAGSHGRPREKNPASGGRGAGVKSSHQGNASKMTERSRQTNTPLAQPSPANTRPRTADPSPTP